MPRPNFLNDEPWDEMHDDLQFRTRWFGHPLGADMLGASLRELLPGSPGGWLHMHYGVEEMFFVLSGTPTLRTGNFPDVVAYPEQRIAWVATRHPERPVPEGGDKGIIARFELPREE
jgi:hypothetical protein